MAPEVWKDAESMVLEKLERLEKGFDQMGEAITQMRVDFASFKTKNNVLWGLAGAGISICGAALWQLYVGN